MPPIALAIGRLVPQKGFDLLIEAVALVGPDVLDSWQVEILGEGPCREELQQLLVSRGLSDRVHLVGQVRDVVERLSRASLFVLSSRFEGFPNALTEAMAAGVASISFDCPTGPRELITPGVDGVLVPPGDVVALSKALTELMTSPDKRRRIGEAARVSMSKYAPNHVGDQWDGLIDEVVSRVRHRRRR